MPGSACTRELPCRDLSQNSGCAVVAFDYRLAPQRKFSAVVEDSCAATVQYPKSRADPWPAFQLLLHPGASLRCLTRAFPGQVNAPGLSTEDAQWCIGQYLASETDVLDPLASPILSADLSGTPPSFVLTAELDPLRDDGEVFAARLIVSGNDVRVRRYLGMPHGFLSLPPVIKRRLDALADVCLALRQAFERVSRP